MTVSPLLAASPIAIGAAQGVAGQLPGQAAAFFRVLASVVGPSPTGDPSDTEAAAPRASLATVGSDLMEGLRHVAVDEPSRVLRGLRRRMTELVQKTFNGDDAEGVRVRITPDGGLHVAGDSPERYAVQRALNADQALADLVSRLPRSWLQAGLEMTIRGR